MIGRLADVLEALRKIRFPTNLAKNIKRFAGLAQARTNRPLFLSRLLTFAPSNPFSIHDEAKKTTFCPLGESTLLATLRGY